MSAAASSTAPDKPQPAESTKAEFFAFIWSHLHLGFRGSVCALAGVHWAQSSREWEEINAADRDRVLQLLRTMAAQRKKTTGKAAA